MPPPRSGHGVLAQGVDRGRRRCRHLCDDHWIHRADGATAARPHAITQAARGGRASARATADVAACYIPACVRDLVRFFPLSPSLTLSRPLPPAIRRFCAVQHEHHHHEKPKYSYLKVGPQAPQIPLVISPPAPPLPSPPAFYTRRQISHSVPTLRTTDPYQAVPVVVPGLQLLRLGVLA